MSSALPQLGSKLSLISNADIRYEGTLYLVDPERCAIALSTVRSFGTEDRDTDYPVPPQSEIHDFILFYGSDIKDIKVVPNVPPVSARPTPAFPAFVNSITLPSSSHPSVPAQTSVTLTEKPSCPDFVPSLSHAPTDLSTKAPARSLNLVAASISKSAKQNTPKVPETIPVSQTYATVSSKKENHSQDERVDSNLRAHGDYTDGQQESTGKLEGGFLQNYIQKELQGISNFRRELRNEAQEIYYSRNDAKKAEPQALNNYRNVARREPPKLNNYSSDMRRKSQDGNYKSDKYNRHMGQVMAPHFNPNHPSGMFPPTQRNDRESRMGGPWSGGYGARNNYSNQSTLHYWSRSHPASSGPPKLDRKLSQDYDFEEANSAFEEMRSQLSNIKVSDSSIVDSTDDKTDDSDGKADILENSEQEQAMFYDRTKSFFDNISCEAAAKTKGPRKRFDWKEELKLNTETFGLAMARLSRYRNARGRYYIRGGQRNFRGFHNPPPLFQRYSNQHAS